MKYHVRLLRAWLRCYFTGRAHFSIDAKSELGAALARLVAHIYRANVELHQVWALTVREFEHLDRRDRIAYFNAKRFLCFQLAP